MEKSWPGLAASVPAPPAGTRIPTAAQAARGCGRGGWQLQPPIPAPAAAGRPRRPGAWWGAWGAAARVGFLAVDASVYAALGNDAHNYFI